ncbi:response regulator transcription factor [Parabacteroides sp. PF5-9]|uniref:response regulator transcription factor n=1 Tax=Parabacteroides sp. PF5-9 TaxID=1742404 RepID=UPI002475CD69|nr:response regulator transcription factor [Parabacteroides sp. PF5-9]MDH6358576.1 DNA-binding response OmpR family regulator [Parabacteroides sp. PF5-9]
MKILVVEDEDALREVIVRSLEKERYLVECVANYQEAMFKINDYDYDCIILDIMLPGGSGLSILEELKKCHKKESVIIISAKDSLEDKITGLDLGADDYLTKPFHLAELNARIKSVVRRKQQDGEMNLILANITLYPDRHAVFIENKELELNRKEFDLLYYFITNPNRVISKSALAESVWGDYIDQADSLDFIYSQVKNLRKKLKTAGATPEIKAVYGFGYKMISED